MQMAKVSRMCQHLLTTCWKFLQWQKIIKKGFVDEIICGGKDDEDGEDEDDIVANDHVYNEGS